MNTISYFEIQVDDIQRAIKFYTQVFGWQFTEQKGMPIEYWSISESGPFGGLLKRPAPVPTPQSGTNAYVCSVEVKNFDETADKIMKNGGIVALPKFAVPGKCWQGYFIDTEGNTFGVFQVDPKAA